MSFPDLGDRITVWVDDHRDVPMKVEGTVVAFRPRDQTLIVLTEGGKRVAVAMEIVIRKYGAP